MTDTTPDELRAREVFEFLSGAEQLDGLWFGDHKPGNKGAFWWRTDLRAVSTALLDRIAAQDAEIARLRECIIAMGRQIPGCALADTVSTDFLMLLPEEMRAWKAKLARATLTGETE